jgi:putative flippase GtrA
MILAPIYQFIKNKPLFAYFIAAGTGVIVQYLVGSMLMPRLFNFDLKTNVGLGFLASIPVGFTLSKVLAFGSKNSGKTKSELFKYAFSLIFSGLITIYGTNFIFILLHDRFGLGLMKLSLFNYNFNLAGTLSHFSGMGLSFIFNFFFHKYFTFKETGLLKSLKLK